MKNKKVNSANIKRHLNDEIKDESPFSGIVLKEKKEEKKKPLPKSQPKKPSEIVQGYNPNASFADILFSYEHTGNPFSMPKSQKKKIQNQKSDFGSILAKWEGTDSKNIKKSKDQKKSEYKPTKSFEAILSEYEGAPIKKEDKKPSIQKRTEAKAVSPQSGYERKSKAYAPSQDFGSILSSFEHRGDKKEPLEIKKDVRDEKINEKPLSESLFKESSEWKRDPSAAWSVLGGNDSFVRPQKEDKKEEPPKEESEAESPRHSSYEPKKDFSEILSAFDERASRKKREEAPSLPNDSKMIEEVESSSLFLSEREDEKRAPGAAWSIFGGNESFRREDAPVDSALPEIPMTEHYKPSVEFSKILDSYEEVKTFDDIMREKGEQNKAKAPLTISKLRMMKPQATLDLHQLTQSEAETAIRDFLAECTENGIRKIAIITGKGLHSEDGVGILKAVADRVLDESGLVSEKKSAPQNAGGSGALWIILKA